MTRTDDRTFPPALAAVCAVGFSYDGGDGVDYEPFDDFPSAEDTGEWLRAWTGNSALDGADFRILGQDGTGGYAAFWLVRADRALTEQPVVFLGSEGERGVVAGDLAGYLWLLADGTGPLEAVERPGRAARPDLRLREIAEQFAPGPPRTAVEVIGVATREFPDFDRFIDTLCR